MGFNLLKSDPGNFHHHSKPLKSDDAFMQNLRRFDFGRYSQWLHDLRRMPDFSFARDLMCDFAQEHYPLPKGSSVYGHMTKARKLHTIKSAVEEEKLDRSVFERFLVENGFAERSEVNGHVLQTRPLKLKDVIYFKGEIKNWVNFGTALKMLGLNKHLFVRLVKSGVFTPMYGGLKTNPYYRVSELMAFNGVVKKSTKMMLTQSPDFINLDEVTRRYTIGTDGIYNMLKSGEIKNAIVETNDPKIMDVRFQLSEHERLFNTPCDLGMTVKEVADKLMLDASAVANLIQQNVLIVAHEINLGGAAVKKYIYENSIKRFDRKFASLKKASFELNVHPTALSKRVKKYEIEYVYTKKYASKILRRTDI